MNEETQQSWVDEGTLADWLNGSLDPAPAEDPGRSDEPGGDTSR